MEGHRFVLVLLFIRRFEVVLSLRNTKVGHSLQQAPPGGIHSPEVWGAEAEPWHPSVISRKAGCLSRTLKASDGNALELSCRNSQDGLLGRMYLYLINP